MIRQKTIIQPDGTLQTQLVQTSYKRSRPPGSCKFRPQMQQLTDRRFMSKPQRQAFDQGQEIWV